MERLKKWQGVVFAIMFLGYGIMFFCRKSFAYLTPVIVEQENLEKSDIGAVGSCLYIAYSISKFVGGVLSDQLNSRVLLTIGLAFVGLCNLVFSQSQSLSVFMLLWFLNGIFQGCGWPPCSKILRQWFPPEILGTTWGLLTSASNIAGSIGPIVLSYFGQIYGWRSPMCISGFLCMLSAILAITFLKNSPSEVGLPPVNKQQRKNSEKDTSDQSDTVQDVIHSPFLWFIAASFFFSLFQAGAVQDMVQLYLIQDKGISQGITSAFLSFYNLGGTAGNLSSGIITDRIVAKYGKRPKGNPRIVWIIITNLIGLGSLFLLRTTVTYNSSQVLVLVLGFLIGYSLYSAISLNGVMVIESSPVHLSGSTHAVSALFGNVGLVLSGFPLGFIASNYSWATCLTVVQTAGVLRLMVMLYAKNVSGIIGRKKKDKEG